MRTRQGEVHLAFDETEVDAILDKLHKAAGTELVVFEEGVTEGDPREADVVVTEIHESRPLAEAVKVLSDHGFSADDLEFPAEAIQDPEDSPLILRVGEEEQPLFDLRDLPELVRRAGSKGLDIQRYKGLGEMNPEQLWETTMDPEKRSLLRVTLEDVGETDRMFNVLMGEHVQPRREFIETYALDAKQVDV